MVVQWDFGNTDSFYNSRHPECSFANAYINSHTLMKTAPIPGKNYMYTYIEIIRLSIISLLIGRKIIELET